MYSPLPVFEQLLVHIPAVGNLFQIGMRDQ